jgi:hypothetical protein
VRPCITEFGGKVEMAKKKTFKIGRSAITGKFLKVKDAKRRKRTAVVETIKKK